MSTNVEHGWTVALRQPAKDKLEIDIYDDIGQGLFLDGVTAKDVLGKLRDAPKAKDIELRVNSGGGILDDAKAMVNLLSGRKGQGATIAAYVDGIAASAASYLLTVADKVVVPSNAFLMFHSARAVRFGTANEMSRAAELLQKTDTQLAEAYAGASKRRGKDKTTDDFLSAMKDGDKYLTGAEAVEWGLADETTEELQAVAMLADVSRLQGAPKQLASAPYIVASASANVPASALTTEQPITPPKQLELPAVSNDSPNGDPTPTRLEGDDMAFAKILTVLNLAENATEDEAVAAIRKVQNSVASASEIETILGATGQKAVGMVRALKEQEARNEELAGKVEALEVNGARARFDSLRAQGMKDRKLTAPMAQRYVDKFEKAVKLNEDGTRNSTGEDIVEDLQGFLEVAPRIVAAPVLQPSEGGEQGSGRATHNSKAFEEMKPLERARLKKDNPELYNTLRTDALHRRAI